MNRRQRAAAASKLDTMTRVWMLMGTIAAALLLVIFALWGARIVFFAIVSSGVAPGHVVAGAGALVPLVTGAAAAAVAARAAAVVARRQVPSLELVGWLWFDVVLLALFAIALVPVGFDVVLVPVLGLMPLVIGLLRLRVERRVEH